MAQYGTAPNGMPSQQNYYGAPGTTPPSQQGNPYANAAPSNANPFTQQQQASQQQQAGVNPFSGYGAAAQPPVQQQQMNSMIPAAPGAQPTSQWALQSQHAAQPQQQQMPPIAPYSQPAPVAVQPPAPAPAVASAASWDPLDPFAQKPVELTPQQISIDQAIVQAPAPAASQFVLTPDPTNPQQTATGAAPLAISSSASIQNQATQLQQQAQNIQTDPEDDDFFGDFATNKSPGDSTSPKGTNAGQAYEINAHTSYDGNDSLSVLSNSINGAEQKFRNQAKAVHTSDGASSHGSRSYNRGGRGGGNSTSPFDDPRFAPPPPPIKGYANSVALARNAPPGSSALPEFSQISHSGYCLARISFRTILIKKWKQIFWVTYGNHRVLIFRSSADFEDWVSNPYLSQPQRDFLVKLDINLVEDLYKENVRGYQVTTIRQKMYANKMLSQFKLERWMDYGPTIAAGFASPNEKEVFNLRTIFQEMMKRSPHDAALQREGGVMANHVPNGLNPRIAHPENPQYRYGSEVHNGQQQHYISGNASTGMLSDGGGTHKSYGVMSSGPVERRSRDPLHDDVRGYTPR